MRVRIILLSLLLALAAACSRPGSAEMYMRTDGRDQAGRYAFDLDMSDTLTYSVELYAVMDCGEKIFRDFGSMKLCMRWVAPSGGAAEETVYMDRSMLVDDTFYNKRFSSVYRTGLRPVEDGLWKLYITVPEDFVEKFGLSGIGLRLLWDTENYVNSGKMRLSDACCSR